jgi:hypothetical protein
MKNVEALEKLAPEVLRRITSWTGNSNGKLDVTTLAPPPEESLIQTGMLIHTPHTIQSPPRMEQQMAQQETQRHLRSPTTSRAPSRTQFDNLMTIVTNLHKEIQLIKTELSKRPADVTVSSEITDALSSLSDRMENVSAEIRSKTDDIATLKTNSDNILAELVRAKADNDMDKAILLEPISPTTN